MLRRRRSLASISGREQSGGQNESIKRQKEDADIAQKERMAKLKMSPFPEERGYVIPLREMQKLNQLSDIKKNLSCSGLELASPALKSPVVTYPSPPSSINQPVNEQESHSLSAAVLKPSDIIELQKYVSPTTAKQKRRSGIDPTESTIHLCVANQAQSGPSQSSSPDQPSASIKSMWDSVVSWMKTAVDYIAFENPDDASFVSPHGKKRPLADIDSAIPDGRPATVKRTRKSIGTRDGRNDGTVAGTSRVGSFGRQKKKSGRRMSFGGLRRTAAGASGDGGLGELLKLEPIKESSLSPPPSIKATPIATSTATTTSSLPSNNLFST